MEIYAPIAHRLGIYWLKSELEDLSFRYLNPSAYQTLKAFVASETQGARGVYRQRHRDSVAPHVRQRGDG